MSAFARCVYFATMPTSPVQTSPAQTSHRRGLSALSCACRRWGSRGCKQRKRGCGLTSQTARSQRQRRAPGAQNVLVETILAALALRPQSAEALLHRRDASQVAPEDLAFTRLAVRAQGLVIAAHRRLARHALEGLHREAHDARRVRRSWFLQQSSSSSSGPRVTDQTRMGGTAGLT